MGERKGTKALELWCKRLVDGHDGVKIENMSTSWRNGLAFCALIHHFRPDLIDFASLKPEDIYHNNELAFRTAETHLGIPALLDPEDMVDHEVPDRLSLLTYLSQFYQRLGSSGTPKKSSSSIEEKIVTPIPAPRKKLPHLASLKIGKSGYEPCTVCSLPVYLAQRLLVSHRLYHRRCFRCAECNAQLSPASCYENATGTEFCCETCNNIEANIFTGKEDEARTSIGMYDEVFNETDPKLLDESRKMENEIKSIDVLPTITPISERLSNFEPKSPLGDDSTISPTYRLRTRATDIEKRNFLLSNLADDNPYTPNSLGDSKGSTTSRSSLVKSRISIFENDDKVSKSDTETDFSLTHHSSPKTLQRVDSNIDIDEFVLNDTPATFFDDENKGISHSSVKEIELSDTEDQKKFKKSTTNYDYEIKFEDDITNIGKPKKFKDVSKTSDSKETMENKVIETSVEDIVQPLVPDFKLLGLKDYEDKHFETINEDIKQENGVLKEDIDILETGKAGLKNKDSQQEKEDFSKRKEVLNEGTELQKEEKELNKVFMDEKQGLTVHNDVLNKEKKLMEDENEVIEEEKKVMIKDVLKEVKTVEKQRKVQIYPDDLNPFSDDEEEENDIMEKSSTQKHESKNKHESTNPFGSSDEEDAEDHATREKKLSNATLNPFWSDGEEPSSEEDETPVNKLNNKRSTLAFSTPTLSMVSPRKRKPMAPKPPTITVHEPPQLNDSLSMHSKYTDDRCSISSFSSHCSTVNSDTKSLRSSPKLRKKRPAPPAPASLHASLLSHNYKEQEPNIASLNKTLDSYFDNEDEKAGRWRRHKGPAPGLPLPGRRVVRTDLPLHQIHTELDHLETQQQGLEKQGVLLEQMIREKCEGEHSVDVPQEEVEDLVIQLCELVNEKNDLFRKQAELMYIRRQQRLEQEQADIEHEIRVIQSRPAVNRIDSEKAREDYLVTRLLAVVRLRDQLVQQLDSERRREIAEDRAIATSIAQRRAQRSMELKSTSLQSLDPSPKKKNRVKDRVKKQLKKAKELTKGSKKKEEQKSDESLGDTTIKTSKSEKHKWF